MTQKQRAEAFLAKAKEADEKAAAAKTAAMRQDWKVIADNYRDLARFKS